MSDQSAVVLTTERNGAVRITPHGWPVPPWAWFSNLLMVAVVVAVASWQITLRGEDPNGVALRTTLNVLNGTGGDLNQYRVLSYYVGYALQQLFKTPYPPFDAMRFTQCVLIFGLAYMLYGRLGLAPRTRLLGIGLIAGLISLNLGTLGPSTFSLDRFTDTIFFLIAALLVLGEHDAWIPPLMVLAVANRETSVFIPALILARLGPISSLFAKWRTPVSTAIGASRVGRRWRGPVFIAVAAWLVGAVVYFGIHAYFGPRPRTEESYLGPAMVLHSLSMPGQTAFFFATVNLLPVVALVSLRNADPFLRRAFWLVVPLWFGIHIWAARLGEGIMYLAPLTVIIVPLVLQGLERQLRSAALPSVPTTPGPGVPHPQASPG